MFAIIQNDPECPAGTCRDALASSGYPFLTLSAYRNDHPFPEPAQLTGVIVLGGEMGVHDTESYPYLERVRSFMARALSAQTPLLGICLGGQLLSQVAGGVVTSSSHGERGICRVKLNEEGLLDPLFQGVEPSFITFQLHNDSFTVPPGARLLAASDLCPAQAFRIGASAYGLQFHPEVDRSIVTAWGSFSTPPVDYLPQFLTAESSFYEASGAILGNFISLAAARRRP